jgi:hypothetical protein
MEKTLRDIFVPQLNQTVKRPCFCLLDEEVVLKEQVSVEDFTLSVMEHITALEKYSRRQMNLDHAWSDQSSIEKYNSAANTFQYLLVHSASGGRIFLQGVPKPKGSVKVRVQLLKQLLAQKRFKVSAHCHFAIKMLRDLKKGRGQSDYVVSDENKHIFDAITYYLLMECAEELLLNTSGNSTGNRTHLSASIG